MTNLYEMYVSRYITFQSFQIVHVILPLGQCLMIKSSRKSFFIDVLKVGHRIEGDGFS